SRWVGSRRPHGGLSPTIVFRRMLFNAFIHNTDDHLRNHGFRRIDGGWRLAPAFDLVPCNKPAHVIAPAPGIAATPDPRAILESYSAFGLERKKAWETYSEIVDGLAALPLLLDRHEVSPTDRATVTGLMPLAFAPPATGSVSRR
ncbi:MAG: HipA domain-containing protein, partial [Alphaproteobacteria bacterium]|nr:HipA domain-containing protein [Alphaproteobacteria bacterium]